MICAYVVVAQRESQTAQVVQKLKDSVGAMEYSEVVSCSLFLPLLYFNTLSLCAGVAIVEYFYGFRKHVFVVYDDLSNDAVAYREMSFASPTSWA